MEYYLESKEIPMFNLLKVFETNNFDWLRIGYRDNQDVNYRDMLNKKALEKHFLIILGDLNQISTDFWLLIIDYCGVIHNINNKNSNLEDLSHELKLLGLKINQILLDENKIIEEVVKERIDLEECTLFEWLSLRENSI